MNKVGLCRKYVLRQYKICGHFHWR